MMLLNSAASPIQHLSNFMYTYVNLVIILRKEFDLSTDSSSIKTPYVWPENLLSLYEPNPK